jgi:hypothetical protein
VSPGQGLRPDVTRRKEDRIKRLIMVTVMLTMPILWYGYNTADNLCTSVEARR